MKAMVLSKTVDLRDDPSPLKLVDLPVPSPAEKEILVKISVCGVCHTELDEIEGRTPPLFFPIVPGHQVIGRVEDTGRGAGKFRSGDRVGIAWIFSACGECSFCVRGMENLCDRFRATGRDAHGGYAEYITVAEDFAFAVPEIFSDAEAAPLLCAGAIGYRSLRLSGIEDGDAIGLSGFGASAHLVIKMIRHRYPNSKVFVFSRTEKERIFAQQLGASWTGDFGDEPPERLRAVIDTTPAWTPVVESLRHLERGGRLVINAIRKEDKDRDALCGIDYSRHLWLEKEIKSVANITRSDVREFLEIAAGIPVRPEVELFSLDEANKAVRELKERSIRGAKVLMVK